MMRGLARMVVVVAIAAALVGNGGVASAVDVSVTGVVLGPDELPFEGATVIARLADNNDLVGSTVTDANGVFTFSLDDDDVYDFTASAPGFGDASLQAYVEAPGPLDVGTLTLTEPGQISGTVTVPPGFDTEVTVHAYLPFNPNGWEAVTGPDGSYVIDGLLGGSQFVVWFDATDPDLVDEWYSDVHLPFFGGQSLISGVPFNGVANASLEVGATVSGTVTGPDGSPVEGASVEALIDGGSQPTVVGNSVLTDSDGHYTLRGVPSRATGASTVPLNVTIRAFPPFGLSAASATTGPLDLFANPVVSDADLQLPGVIFGTAQLFRDGVPDFTNLQGPGVCVAPAVFRPSGIGCTDNTNFQSFTSRPATQDYLVGPLAPGTYTARAAAIGGGYGPVATFTVDVGDTFHCTLPETAIGPIVPECVVTPLSAGDGDGVDDAAEGGAPNGGDGNDDGIPDAEQAEVASLPVDSGYLTIAAPTLTELRDVLVTPAWPPAPTGVQLETGLISFGVGGIEPGSSVDVDIILSAGTSANAYWKYDVGVGWYDATSLATFDGNTITLHLTDGELGDEDGLANGVIDDPGAPAIEERVPPTITCPAPAPTVYFGEPGSLEAAVSDTGSGTSSPTLTVPVSTTAAGPHTVDVVATDLVGNTGTATCAYTVQGYGFGGFQSPVDPLPKVNEANAGSNVPLKWRLLSPRGVPVSDPASFVSATFRPRPCASSVYDTLEFEAPSVGLAYKGNGEWDLGWKTSKAWAGCGDLELRFADGSVRRAAFSFK